MLTDPGRSTCLIPSTTISNSPSKVCATCSCGWECSGRTVPAGTSQYTNVMPADRMNFPRQPGKGDFSGRSSRFVVVIAALPSSSAKPNVSPPINPAHEKGPDRSGPLALVILGLASAVGAQNVAHGVAGGAADAFTAGAPVTAQLRNARFQFKTQIFRCMPDAVAQFQTIQILGQIQI